MKNSYMIYEGSKFVGVQVAGHAERACYLFAAKLGLDWKALRGFDFATPESKLPGPMPK